MNFKSASRTFAFVAVAALALTYAAYLGGARINRTHSLPKGLYWIVPKSPERGDIVSFRPQDTEPFRAALDRGYIIAGSYNGYGPMLKKLLALPGDVVSITDDGVTVNGTMIPNTRPFKHDRIGDPLPQLRLTDYVLAEHEALFVSDYLPRSFDSRYFGVQDIRQILAVLSPVYVWHTQPNKE